MHPLTKIGLTLIALTWFAASTALSMQALRVALSQGAQMHEVTMPCVWRGNARLPTDV